MANAARTSQDTGRNSASSRDTSGTSGGRGRQTGRGDQTQRDVAQGAAAGDTSRGRQTAQGQVQVQGQSRAQAHGQSGTQPGDTERQVPLGRETQRQAGVSVRDQGPSAASTQRGVTSPFSFMRRFGEEMDRLFEDFGFAPLGLDPIDFLSAQRSGLAPSRALSGGTSGQGGLATTGGSGLTRLPSGGALPTGRGIAWLPQVEVLQRGDSLVVRADLPGLKPEDVRVEVDNGALTVSGERSYQAEDENEGVYHSERAYGAFLRTIPLPQGINPDDVQARFNNGVLEVTIPLPKESRSKRIAVR